MNCIEAPQSIEHIVKKSRFIGFAAPCLNESEVMNVLRAIHAKHCNANHLAFAYKVFDSKQTITRFNDAGEPKGTAGKPILAHIEGKDLINTVIAVIRYFGGIKLGAGGLVRAYGTTTKNVLECCNIITYTSLETFTLSIGYQSLNTVQHELKNLGGQIISQDFGAQIELVIQIPADKLIAFQKRFNY